MKKGYRKCRFCGEYYPSVEMEKVQGVGWTCESCLEVEYDPYDEEEIRCETPEEIDNRILYDDMEDILYTWSKEWGDTWEE